MSVETVADANHTLANLRGTVVHRIHDKAINTVTDCLELSEDGAKQASVCIALALRYRMQAADILHDEHLRAGFGDDAQVLEDQFTSVILEPTPTTEDGERLAWGAASHERKVGKGLSRQRREVLRRQFLDAVRRQRHIGPVATDRFNTGLVDLIGRQNAKAGTLQAKVQAHRPGKKREISGGGVSWHDK